MPNKTYEILPLPNGEYRLIIKDEKDVIIDQFDYPSRDAAKGAIRADRLIEKSH